MGDRREFEMTEADLQVLLKACRPIPLIMCQYGMPRSPQETANAAWGELGKKMGFDFMSVKPLPSKGDRFFTAIAQPAEHDAERA